MVPMRIVCLLRLRTNKKCTNNLRQYFHNLNIIKTKPPAEQGVIFT